MNDPDTSSVGIVGLGLLGGAIRDRLVSCGWKVVGFDLDAERRRETRDRGCGIVDSVEKLFDTVPLVVLALPDSDAVARVTESIATRLTTGRVVVDTTTGDPARILAVAQRIRERGADYVESCVAGSSEQVRRGEASLFLGGRSDLVARLEPLCAMGGSVHHLGDVGSATRFKLVHNLALGLHRAVLAETLAFAESLGFDATRTVEILRTTPARSAVMDVKGLKMATRNYDPVARLAQHAKDVNLILESSATVGLDLPLSNVHRALLERAIAAGFGDADNAAIREAYGATAERQT